MVEVSDHPACGYFSDCGWIRRPTTRRPAVFFRKFIDNRYFLR